MKSARRIAFLPQISCICWGWKPRDCGRFPQKGTVILPYSASIISRFATYCNRWGIFRGPLDRITRMQYNDKNGTTIDCIHTRHTEFCLQRKRSYKIFRMNTTMILLSIFSIIGYLFSRGFIELFVSTFLSKKEYKTYKNQTKFLQRYWLTWLKRNVAGKYVKSERRNVNFPAIMSVFFYTHITLFISLAITIFIVFSVCFGFLDMVYAEVMLLVYLTEVILSFVIYSFAENHVHRKYHQKRHKR